MKLFTNLPGFLRVLFGALRALTVLLAVFWLLTLTFHTWIQQRFPDNPRLMVSLGEIALPGTATTIGLASDTAKAGSLAVTSLRGGLQADLASPDAALVSALRRTMLPSMVVFVAFAWTIFSALRRVCANIEQREVFTEKNLRLVQGIGLVLILYSFATIGVGLWATQVMNGYLAHHVTLTGLGTGAGAPRFLLPPGLLSASDSLVIGALVLVVSEAFRQGLALKTENDLTV